MIAVGYSKRAANFAVNECVPLKEQNDRIRKFAKENGYKISHFYEDKSNDPGVDSGFQKMRIDGLNRKFNLVILDSIYRCGKSFNYARNLLLMTFYKIGIHFVVLEDNINTLVMTETEVERYFRELRSKRAEVIELSDRQEKYKKSLQLDDHWERYGYCFNEDKTKLIVDETAASVIRYIFSQASMGVRKIDIARKLNEQGVESPASYANRRRKTRHAPGREDWGSDTIRRILKNKKFMGDDSAKDTEGAVYLPIIEPELFEKAQRVFYTIQKRNYKNQYLFSNMVFNGNTKEKLSYRERETENGIILYFHEQENDNPVIEFKTLCEQVFCELKREKLLAEAVLSISKEKRLVQMNVIDASYHDRAKELFEKALEAQDGNVELYLMYEAKKISKEEYEFRHECIMKKQEEVEKQFRVLMAENKKCKVYLGKDNPWVRRFHSYDPGMEFNRSVALKLIQRIDVYSDTVINVTLNTQGKEYIPKEFLEVDIDGKKE